MWWIKKFRRRKIQSLLIFLVIAMCTTLIAGSTVILTSLTSVYQELAEETNAPDVKVYSRPGFQDKDYKTSLEGCESVNRVVPIDRYTITTITFEGKETDAFVDVCKYEPGVYKDVRILEGSLDDLKEGTCMLPAATAKSIGAKKGDTIEVSVNGKKLEYQVSGIFVEIYSAAIEYTCDILVSELPEEAEISKVYGVWLSEGRNTDDLIGEYTEDNNGILDGYFKSKDDCIMNAEIAELILGGILLGISSVVFLAILLILGYIVKNCFRSEKNTIAVYKTMGYTNSQIRKIYITFYLSIIGAGAVAGGLLSPVLSNSFIKKVYENIGYSGINHGILQIVICVVTIILIAFLILLLETRRISKLKPVEILNGSDEGIGRKKLRYKQGKHSSFSPLAMALRMMRRDKKNTLLLILTCIVSLYIVNLSVVCLQNLDYIRGKTNYYWLGIDKHDITIENTGDIDRFYDICEEIKEDQKTEKVVRKNFDRGFAIPYHQTTSVMVYDTFDGVETPILQGRNPKYPDEAVVGNIYLKELGINVGDYITVQMDETHRKDLLVVGTYQGFFNMGRGMKVMGSLFEENDVEYEYPQCSITLKDGEDKKSYIDYLKSTYGEDIKVTDSNNLYESIMDTICDPQRAALLPFTVITVVIGALNAFYIIYASNMEKRKKFTIYKSLGFTSNHLLKMNCIYVAVVVAVSIAIAVPAFIFLFPKVMILSMSAFGFAEYKLVISPLLLFLINGGMMVVFLASAVLAAVDIFKNYIGEIMNE